MSFKTNILRPAFFASIFIGVMFGALFILGNTNKAYAGINYVAAAFANRENVTLIVSYAYYYSLGGAADACQTGPVLSPADSDCKRLAPASGVYQFLLNPTPSGNSGSNDPNLPNNGIIIADSTKPPAYYVSWYAQYTDGSECVDPSVELEQYLTFYTVNIDITCTSQASPPPPPTITAPKQPTTYGVALQECLPAVDNLPDVTFSWTGVSGATGYYVYIWDPGYVITNGIRDAGYVGADPRWTHGSLTSGTSYKWIDLPNYAGFTWAVRSRNNTGMSSVTFWKTDTSINCNPPDLDITSIRTTNSAGTTKTTFNPGNTVYVEIKVKNWGSGRSATNFNTIYRVANISNCVPEGAQQNFGTASLGPGAQITLNGSFVVGAGASGSYTINAMTDVYCVVAESNEGNNRASVNYTVQTTGQIIGRLWQDSNQNGIIDVGEKWVQNGISCDPALNVTVANVSVSISGPSSRTVLPTQCNAPSPTGQAYYVANPLLTGNYTVSANLPAGWIVTGVDQSAPSNGGVLWTVTNGAVSGALALNANRDIKFGIVQGPPSDPSNLTATTACNQNNQPTITFTWTDAENETGYWLDVNTQQWTNDTAPAGWYIKSRGANVVTFQWSATSAVSLGGSSYYPQRSTTYWWRLQAFNGDILGNHVYPANTLIPTQGGSIATLDCRPNLQVEITSLPDGIKGAGGNAALTVTNTGTGWTYPSGIAGGALDEDGDGFSDTLEKNTLGTNEEKSCPTSATPNDETKDAWPPDFNDDQKADAVDLALIQAAFGTTNARYDMNGSGGPIDISDIGVFGTHYNKNCTGIFEVAMNLDEAAISIPMDCSDPKSVVATKGPLGPAGSGQESTTFTMTFTYPSAADTYTAWALVDSACGVVESDESDNTATKSYSVSNYDLSADFVGGSWNKTVFFPGETATAKVKVSNLPPVYYAGPTTLGVWPGQSGQSVLPACSAAGVGGSTPPSISFTNPIPVNFTVSSQTKTYQIQAGLDDGARGQAGFYNTTTDIAAGKPFSSNDGYRSSFMRFTNVDVPQGATVTSAKLIFTARDTSSGTGRVETTISAEDADDTATVANIDDWDSRVHTAAVNWSITADWTANTVGYQSIDFSPAVQAVLSRGGWASGNSIMIFWENNLMGGGNNLARVAKSYESSAAGAPKLEITYTVNTSDIEVPISFNVGNTEGTFIANAYVNPGCTSPDEGSSWANNSTASIGHINFTYHVKVDGWFETTGGDAGSGGTVSVSLSPLPANKYQSSYLLAGKTLDPSVRSAKWSIGGYDKPLVAADPYTYIAERFRQDAIAAHTVTQISEGISGLNYINGNVTYSGGAIASGNLVFFIDGNLVIGSNLTVTGSNNTVTFIVAGNVTVNTGVTQADGVYIVGKRADGSGGTFSSTDTAGGVSGSQLVINGAVYGANVSLSRKLGGPSCVGLCSNTTDPAEIINYDPKYLIALNDLLGSPGVAWKEVAP